MGSTQDGYAPGYSYPVSGYTTWFETDDYVAVWMTCRFCMKNAARAWGPEWQPFIAWVDCGAPDGMFSFQDDAWMVVLIFDSPGQCLHPALRTIRTAAS